MDLTLVRSDVACIPAALRALADRLDVDDPWRAVDTGLTRRVLLLGMGSSAYAAGVVAARMRADGLDAVADLASAEVGWPTDPGMLVVAISATGGSVETVAAARRHAGGSRLVALTNTEGSDLARMADSVVPLQASEASGVASVSYAVTLGMLLALRARLAGGDLAPVAVTARRAADSVEDLLTTSDSWLPRAAARLASRDGLYVLGPAQRLCSAQQSALMVREIPRRPATGCETGDWAHVDVYLAKTLDYRVLLLPGSRWDGQAMEWLRARGATVQPVGAEVADALPAIRYRGDDDPDIRLLAEVTVAQLLAVEWWQNAGEGVTA